MKRVEVIFEFSPEGEILVFTKGTEGPECLSLMEFLDRIDSLKVIKTVTTEEFNTRKVVNQETVKDLT